LFTFVGVYTKIKFISRGQSPENHTLPRPRSWFTQFSVTD